jgi:hypothetical protein
MAVHRFASCPQQAAHQPHHGPKQTRLELGGAPVALCGFSRAGLRVASTRQNIALRRRLSYSCRRRRLSYSLGASYLVGASACCVLVGTEGFGGFSPCRFDGSALRRQCFGDRGQDDAVGVQPVQVGELGRGHPADRPVFSSHRLGAGRQFGQIQP